MDSAEYDLSDYGLDGTATVESICRGIRIGGITADGILGEEIAYVIALRFISECGSSIPPEVASLIRPLRKRDYEEFASSLEEVMDSITMCFANVSRLSEKTDDLKHINRIGSILVDYSKNELTKLKDVIPEERYEAYSRHISFKESYIRSLILSLRIGP